MKRLLIKGHTAIFNHMDMGFDIIYPGAFKSSLESFYETKDDNLNRFEKIPLLWNHIGTEPIGKIINLYEDEIGLYLEAIISHPDYIPRVKIGNGLSFGYRAMNFERVSGFRTLKTIALFEISLVKTPMNKLAVIESIEEID